MCVYTFVLYMRISRPEDGGCMSLRNHKCPLYVLSTLNAVRSISLTGPFRATPTLRTFAPRAKCAL
jgi:hypothetical protein